MSGGGSGGSQTTVQKADPWSAQQPYLLDIFSQAQKLNETPQSYFPGATFAAPSAETLSALDLQQRRALAGSPLTGAAQQALTGTLNGDYLSAGNPYFSAMLGQAASAIRPQLDAQFAGAGRYGSGAYAHALTSALADTAGQLAYQNYDRERQNQMAAAAAAPQLANQDYFDIAKLAEVGSAREAAEQQQIDDARARFQFAQDEPYQRLQRYANLIQGNYGGSSTSTVSATPGRASIGQGMLGGAATGAALGSIVPGIGTGIGAAIGALGGLLFR
jgi:hypothetical protein